METLQDVEVVKMCSMSTYSVAIDHVGGVFVWGTGGSASAMHSTKTDILPQLLEALPNTSNVIDISCGLGHALFLLDTGKVYSWGNGGNGRLGLGDVSDRTEACLVNSLSDEIVISVQCGASHSMVLTDKAQVYSWGKNTQGQCGHGCADDILRPQMIKKFDDVRIQRLAAGWEHSVALSTEGRLYAWGCGYKDSRRGVIPPVLGLGHNECRMTPEMISSIDTVKIVNVICGWDHCLALDDKGKLLSWGSGQNGKLGQGNEDNVSIPCYLPTMEDIVVVHISAGCEHSAAITEDGAMYSWGHGDGGRLGHGNNAQCFSPTVVEAFSIMNCK